MGSRLVDTSSAEDNLIPYRSEKGKALLMHCMASRSGDIYMSLSEQFLTQSSPPSCGVATLAMILNSLRVDPGRVWRGPWRWFTEDMLVSCFPSDSAELNMGLTMEHFGLIAECNGATAQTFYGSSISQDDFRATLQSVFEVDGLLDRRMAVAFDRAVLGQTGTGHYSPLGAYNREADMVLVMDVARFKYPPYWVPVEVLWRAMRTVDPETKRSRGYFVMSRAPVKLTLDVEAYESVPITDLDALAQSLADVNNVAMKVTAAELVHNVRKRMLSSPCLKTSCSTLFDCAAYKDGAEILEKVKAMNIVTDDTVIREALSQAFMKEDEMRPIDFFIQSMPQFVNELITLLILDTRLPSPAVELM